MICWDDGYLSTFYLIFLLPLIILTPHHRGLAFALDPDGYWVEIIKRGGYDDAGTPYFTV